ncbi:MAG: sugar diacid recognition domain-containing protein [Bilifractor sp.]|nr:sugar diacid recognition domain-containing protein [Bilifractor sp.]
MKSLIRHRLAQQMVDTIHDVCGYNINFISPEGKITASTDPERIGMFHEIGRKAAESGETIEVDSNEDYSGTRKGINIPIYYHNSVIAVIGITAEPSEARKYAHLAERISALLLHEQEIGEMYRSTDERRAYLIRCIQNEDFENLAYFDSCLKEFHVDPKGRYRMLCIEINTRYNLVNISLLEQKVRAFFNRIGEEVYTYIYPNRFAGLIRSESYKNYQSVFRRFASDHHQILQMAVGSDKSFEKCGDSWRDAVIAISSIRGTGKDLVAFDDLKLEILLSGMSDTVREEYRRKVLGGLKPSEVDFLKTYYDSDMSLKASAEKLFLHVNTVQQRLNRIAGKTGMNPRNFRDAVLFWLAMHV